MLQYVTFAFSVLSAITSALWIYANWVKRRENYPKIDVSCSINEIARTQKHIIIQINAEVTNTGNVRHIFNNIKYDLYAHDLKKVRNGNNKILNQLYFPFAIREEQRFFPVDWEYSFVDAGTTSKYKHIICIPAHFTLLKLSVMMMYRDKESDFHNANWIGKI